MRRVKGGWARASGPGLALAICASIGCASTMTRPRAGGAFAGFSAGRAVGDVGSPVGASGGSIFEKDWTWQDENGRPLHLSAWRGRDLVVSLIYTTCTTVCPRAIEKMREIDLALARAGRVAEYVLVTLDPTADTPEELRRFKATHGLPDRWHLLRGRPEQTEALATFLRLKLMNLGDHVIHEPRLVFLDASGVLLGQVRG